MLTALLAIAFALLARPTFAEPDLVRISSGAIEGLGAGPSGVRIFLGIPYAAPPVGSLRWKEPQSVQPWRGVRKALAFGARCMQRHYFDDMIFRSTAMSEDCLFLNVWTPSTSGTDKLPVLVYIHGCWVCGDGSEPRYDGERMAREGIVVVTLNYRVDIFGFLAHPGLSAEAPYRGSGNYGLLDQSAALRWVRQNIGAFGGDAARVTIAGESGGSISVSALVVSPMSRHLIAGAIGESGSIMGSRRPVPLQDAEQFGLDVARHLKAGSVGALRAIPAARLLLYVDENGDTPSYPVCIDGRFFLRTPEQSYAAGEYAHVPVLAGNNSAEGEGQTARALGTLAPTRENFRAALMQKFGPAGERLAELYPGADDPAAVLGAARDLAGDLFIAWSTWKWMTLSTRVGGDPTWFYLYAHPRPLKRAQLLAAAASSIESDAPVALAPPRGANHAVEIEYALGNLAGNTDFDWSDDDVRVSSQMLGWFASFIKTGDPNGFGPVSWPRFATGKRMRIDVTSRAEPDPTLPRYQLLDQLLAAP